MNQYTRESLVLPGLLMTRAVMKSMGPLLVGESAVPAVPVGENSRGIDGSFWFSWPGVDTRSDAPTIIAIHGGE